MLQESDKTPRPYKKNIVLCFDGTGDWAGADSTNVTKIYERLDRQSQCVFYTGGVGTLGSAIALSPMRRAFLKLLDLAIATSLRDKVLEGYTFIIRNYQEGDDIYLFGFSRGAFTARLLAAVIHCFGLLRAENENLAPYLWQTIDQFDSFEDFKRDSQKLKDDFSQAQTPDIRFMGLFDTVSSVGVFERFKVYPYTDKNPSVQTIRHAVSINEQRNCFPELLIVPDGNDVSEVWFPGVHRDVGGGVLDHPGLSNQTLNWMMAEASVVGLKLDVSLASTDDAKPHYGPFDPYVLAGLYPMKMTDYSIKQKSTANLGFAALTQWRSVHKDSKDPGFRWFWPNFTHHRQIPNNAYIFVGGDQVLVGVDFKNAGATWDERNSTWKYADDGPAKNMLPLAEAKCLAAPAYEPIKQNSPDTVGTIVGVALAFVILYKGLWEAFATAFPGLRIYDTLGWPWPRVPIYGEHTWLLFSSACAFWLFVIFVVHKMFSERLGLNPAGRRINKTMPYLGILAVIGLATYFRPWLVLYIGFVLGVKVAFLSQLGRRPVLPADRAIAYFMVPWFLIVVGFAVLNYIAQLIWPFLAAALEFVALGHFTYLELPFFQTFLVSLACLAAVVTWITGMVNIDQDRKKMGASESNPVN